MVDPHILCGTMVNISSHNTYYNITTSTFIHRSLKLFTNLTSQQVYVNSYSKVTLKFVVPVLDKTTAKTLQTFAATETSQTAKYCQMLDQFFECVNVRSLEKYQKKTNPFLKPCINENDERFSWMINQFLP